VEYEDHIKDASTWAAMWQGTPTTDDLSLFNEPTYYDTLPLDMIYVGTAFGLDLAYSDHGGGDYNVCVRVHRYDDKQGNTNLFVDGVIRTNTMSPTLFEEKQLAPF